MENLAGSLVASPLEQSFQEPLFRSASLSISYFLDLPAPRATLLSVATSDLLDHSLVGSPRLPQALALPRHLESNLEDIMIDLCALVDPANISFS